MVGLVGTPCLEYVGENAAADRMLEMATQTANGAAALNMMRLLVARVWMCEERGGRRKEEESMVYAITSLGGSSLQVEREVKETKIRLPLYFKRC